MASLYPKKVGGKTYWYLRQMARVNGKPKMVSERYLGSAEDIEAAIQGSVVVPERTRHLAFGAVAAGWAVLGRLRVVEIVDEVVGPRRADAGASVGTYLALAALRAATSSGPLCQDDDPDSPSKVKVPGSRTAPPDLDREGRGSAHTVSREASQIASTDPDLVVVTLHRSRSARVAQDDRCARVSPGDLVALDTTRAFQLAVAECCDVVVLGLPRGMLGSHADRIARSTAVPVRSDTAVRTLISAFLTGLGDNTQHLSTTNIHLAEAVASLLIAALAGTTPQHVEVASTLTDRILAATLADLGDPALCAAAMARRHGISPRHLHNLLSQRGHTFAAWARQQRLRRIHHDLCDPSLAGRTAAAIAARWGIHDARHLGRALRREYGQTAAEIRSTGTSQTWAGRPPPETSCQAATDFVT